MKESVAGPRAARASDREFFSPSGECWCPRGGETDSAVQCMVLILGLSNNEVAPASVTTRCFMTWILALHKVPQRRMCVYVVYVCHCGLCMYICSVSLCMRVCVCSMCMVCSIMWCDVVMSGVYLGV